MHVTSTQMLTIPVIIEDEASSRDIVLVAETVKQPEAIAFVASSVTSDQDKDEEIVYITVTIDNDGT